MKIIGRNAIETDSRYIYIEYEDGSFSWLIYGTWYYRIKSGNGRAGVDVRRGSVHGGSSGWYTSNGDGPYPCRMAAIVAVRLI